MENIEKIEDFVWTCKGFTKKNQKIQWKHDELSGKAKDFLMVQQYSKYRFLISTVF